MAVFSEKEDEIVALVVGNALVIFGLIVGLANFWWLPALLGWFVLAVGVYVLVVAFKEYQIEGIKQMWQTYLLLLEAVQRQGVAAWTKQ